jgi:hypothetical protein
VGADQSAQLIGCRAIGFFHDPGVSRGTAGIAIPRTDRVFIGFGKAENFKEPAFVLSGGYDPASPSGIRWTARPEVSESDGPINRIMSFAELDGHFYFTTKPSVYERGYDNGKPHWTEIYRHPGAGGLGVLASGLRGLSTVPYRGGQSLLAVMEGSPGDIVRLDRAALGTGPSVVGTIETNVDREAAPAPMTYIIGAFNDIPTITDPTGTAQSLIGLEHYTKIPGHESSAFFLSR